MGLCADRQAMKKDGSKSSPTTDNKKIEIEEKINKRELKIKELTKKIKNNESKCQNLQQQAQRYGEEGNQKEMKKKLILKQNCNKQVKNDEVRLKEINKQIEGLQRKLRNIEIGNQLDQMADIIGDDDAEEIAQDRTNKFVQKKTIEKNVEQIYGGIVSENSEDQRQLEKQMQAIHKKNKNKKTETKKEQNSKAMNSVQNKDPIAEMLASLQK